MLKIFFNITIMAVFTAFILNIIFFRIIPLLIKKYRAVRYRSRDYKKQLVEIDTEENTEDPQVDKEKE